MGLTVEVSCRALNSHSWYVKDYRPQTSTVVVAPRPLRSKSRPRPRAGEWYQPSVALSPTYSADPASHVKIELSRSDCTRL